MSEVHITSGEVYRAEDGWRWRSKAANGEIVAQGEAYEHYGDAFAACAASIPDDAPIVRVTL